VPWRSEDWRAEEDHRSRLEALLDEDRRRGFDLEEPPLLRFILIRLADEEWYFVWSHHHLLLDGWCLGLILDEVFRLYRADTGAPGAVAELPERRPYRDYIAWLEGRDLGEAEAFWRRKLDGAAIPTPLGVGGESSPEAPRGKERLSLDAATGRALDALTRGQRVTMSTVFHAAWAVLLARYGGEDDVVFGTVVSGRPPELPGAESMIGLFINTLPVRARVPQAGEESAGAWLGRLQSELLELRQHEHTPLARVHAWAGLPSDAPLFESLFVFENYQRAPRSAGQGMGVRVVGADIHEQTGYPLSLAVIPSEPIVLQLGFDGGRFDAATVRGMLRHLALLVATMARDPDCDLASIPLLTLAERHTVLREWGEGGARSAPACLH
jgi:hypothetical protein